MKFVLRFTPFFMQKFKIEGKFVREEDTGITYTHVCDENECIYSDYSQIWRTIHVN